MFASGKVEFVILVGPPCENASRGELNCESQIRSESALNSNINQAMNELAKGEMVKKAQFRLRRNSYVEGKEGRNRLL